MGTLGRKVHIGNKTNKISLKTIFGFKYFLLIKTILILLEK